MRVSGCLSLLAFLRRANVENFGTATAHSKLTSDGRVRRRVVATACEMKCREVQADALSDSQLITSIYFDSLDAVSYRQRINREEGARLVRFRWYENNQGEPDKEIFIERKIHHEGWTTDLSAKERFTLPQKDVAVSITENSLLTSTFRRESSGFTV